MSSGFGFYIDDNREFFPHVNASADANAGESEAGGWICYTHFAIHDRADSIDFDKSALYPYVRERKLYACPANNTVAAVTYAINSDASHARLSQVKNSAATPLVIEEGCPDDGGTLTRFTDDGAFWVSAGGSSDIRDAHSRGSVYGYFDGHAVWEQIKRDDCLKACDFRAPWLELTPAD